MNNIILKLFLIACSINVLFAKQVEFDLKYWHLSEMSYMDFVSNKKEKKIFNDWLNSEPNPFTIFSNVSEEYAVKSISVFHKNYCTKDLTEKDNIDKKNCILIAPGLTKTFSFKQYNAIDRNDIFRNKPIMYSLNNELGVIIFDLSNSKESINSSLELELKYIENVYDYFKKESQLNDQQIIILGNFGVTNKELEKYINKNKFKLNIKEPTEIITVNNKTGLADTINIITHIDNNVVKNIKIWSNIHMLNPDNKKLNKKEELEFIRTKLSNFYPLSIRISYDFKSLDFLK